MPAQHIPNKLDIPTFDQIILYTGNVLHSVGYDHQAKLWKKSNRELIEGITSTLYGSLQESPSPSLLYNNDTRQLEVPNLNLSNRIHPDDRKHVEVTAKLFYLDQSPSISHINQAIHHLQRLLNVESIDTFIVSMDNKDLIGKVWQDLELHHERGTIHKLGVSDFDHRTLNQFINNIKVKPYLNQVHVDQCCSLPADLIQLGKKNGIELTYNGDITEIITADTLSSLMSEHGLITMDTQVTPRWVLKYDVFYQYRSVVADKGYIVVGDVKA
ncbi:hypothetical protein BDB01DRAFT_798617 [Pilobolus umbonatus]|nr:hypothetical protein BDB01DRAFT_798617 [Pilobolus umbonatus]